MSSKDELATKIEKRIDTPMIVLALLIIPIVVIELEIVPTNTYWVSCATKIDDGIWFAFLLEYLVLVSLYDDKVGYTKRSWLNLIILLLSPPLICPEGFALIRSLRSLRVLRLFRALRLLRIVIALKRGVKPISDVFVKNSLHYVTLITILLIIFSGIAFSWLELRVISIQGIFQGVWWAITTVTTVGYGDLYPKSHAGRILAAAVMIIGIGFVSVLTANISSYFVENDMNKESEDQDRKDENQLILKRLDELSKKIDEINRRLP
ncbi:MAG: two pore domain potassium channel family protein [Methanosarcinales archaeon]|nr:MAG: two pore domain potassium channel family protein [Methanosarcinales archaeon]